MWKRGLLLAALTCAGAGDVERVTTDSKAYCDTLTSILDHSHPGEEARALEKDGQRRCADGDTREGVTQLRRALMLSREDPH